MVGVWARVDVDRSSFFGYNGPAATAATGEKEISMTFTPPLASEYEATPGPTPEAYHALDLHPWLWHPYLIVFSCPAAAS
jgi:hypothetical protein